MTATRLTLIGLGLLTALRVVALVAAQTDLGGDEAQYWVWAQTPAFGYFSKPPFIAWLIAGTTALCGDGEACVRLGSPLLHGGTAALIFFLARALFDARTGVLSAFAYATVPGVSFSASLISTDVPLLFFWALGLLALTKLLARPCLGAALALGTAIGLGLLSKYAMFYFLLSLGVAVLILPQVRRAVLSKYGALALLVALLLFAPNVAWNAAHRFVTAGHTLANANLGATLFHPRALLEFIGGQFGVFGPILFTALLLGLVALAKTATASQAPAKILTERDANLLLAVFVVPVLLFACGVALLSRANANWAAPAYVAATPLAIHWLLGTGRKAFLRASFGLHLFVAAALPVGLAWPGLADLAGFSNALKRVRGWEALGVAITARAAEAPYSALLTNHRMLMGELIYYTRKSGLPVVMWDFDHPPGNHYELTMRVDAKTGARALLVCEDENPAYILSRFERVEPRGSITATLDARRARTVYLYAVSGLKPRVPP